MTAPARKRETARRKPPSERRQSIQVISRAAAILRALEAHPDGLSLGEIAAMVELPRSTVQRIVDALARENYVLASSSARGVRLGPALLRLGAADGFGINRLARPTLEALARETGETVDLALSDDGKVIFVDQVAGTHRLLAVSGVGLSFPLHSSANGKAVLATYDGAALARVKRRLTLDKRTPHTITSWPDLERELERIRETGVAYDFEENSLGICAVATAIHFPTGEVGVISIPVPTQRFQDASAELTRALVAHCTDLQASLQRNP